MLERLFPRGRRHQKSLAPAIPTERRIYAIGDIHGRLDLLRILLDKIEADDAGRAKTETILLFLGDLIDRGPESAQVVSSLREIAASRAPGSTRFLLGNHEEVFLAALAGDLKALRFFNKIGGRETILSYGVPESVYLKSDYPELLEALRDRVPASDIEFLQSFEDMIILGDYVFVHAGIQPNQPLHAQRISDLRWIRNEFLEFKGDLEKIVVHGHSISDDVEILRNRIGLDTGAFASGRLTAMGFENSERWVLQTTG